MLNPTDEPGEPGEPVPGVPGEPAAGPGVGTLIGKMKDYGFDKIPTVTMIVLVGKILLYQGKIKLPWEKVDACISADEVINNHDYRRMFISVFEHADERHLYFNMASFFIKGRTLENKNGSINFAILLIFFILFSNVCYVVLAYVGANFLGMEELMSYCTIGFSGVVFTMKVVCTAETGKKKAYIMGVEVPTKFAAWGELLAMHKVVPSSSTFSHVAGVVAGLAYIGTPLGYYVDYVVAHITGSKIENLPYLDAKRQYEEPPPPEPGAREPGPSEPRTNNQPGPSTSEPKPKEEPKTKTTKSRRRSRSKPKAKNK